MIKRVLLVLLAVWGIGCSHPNQERLINKHWDVIRINGEPQKSRAYLHFQERNQMSLHMSANTCNGQITLKNQQILIDQDVCSTRCCDDSLSLVVRDIIFGESQYTLNDSLLTLKSDRGSVTFRATPETFD